MNKGYYDKINNFNNDLKEYSDRKNFVENAHDELNSDMAVMKIAMNNRQVAEALEKQATYLLNSSDVESGRKLEYGYYRDDKDYKSNYAIGERTMLTDNLEEFEGYLSTSYEKSECSADVLNLKNMTPENKKRFLKYKFDDISDLSETFQSKIKILIDNMIKETHDEKDRFVIQSMVNGLDENQISERLGISRRAVNKRLNKICERGF